MTATSEVRTTEAAWRTLPMGAGALAQCWGRPWLRPAARAERDAWFDGTSYSRIVAKVPEFDPNGRTHTLMTLLESTPANVKSYLRDFEMVTEGPLEETSEEW